MAPAPRGTPRTLLADGHSRIDGREGLEENLQVRILHSARQVEDEELAARRRAVGAAARRLYGVESAISHPSAVRQARLHSHQRVLAARKRGGGSRRLAAAAARTFAEAVALLAHRRPRLQQGAGGRRDEGHGRAGQALN